MIEGGIICSIICVLYAPQFEENEIMSELQKWFAFAGKFVINATFS